jgi:hypothetical protein
MTESLDDFRYDEDDDFRYDEDDDFRYLILESLLTATRLTKRHQIQYLLDRERVQQSFGHT